MGLKFPLVTSKKDTFSFLILIILFLIGGFLGGCRFQPNPDLEFLTESEEDRGSCLFPQWAPNGDKIYYLDGSFSPYKSDCCGELWEIKVSTRKKKKIIGGEGNWFTDFTLSPNSKKVALINHDEIFLLNLTTMELDTVFSLSGGRIEDVVFSSKGDKIFYSVEYSNLSGLYSLSLENREIRAIIKSDRCGEFDISEGDSILVMGKDWWGWFEVIDSTVFKRIHKMEGVAPKISPTDPDKVVIVESWGDWGYGDTYLTLWDLSDSTCYHLDTKIAKNGHSHCPDWSPDSEQIVFSASEKLHQGGPYLWMVNTSLWILKKIKE